ncbi:ABC transporter domain-containing protein [Caenorhabditis elegans]|uniref:ABC transporter domain-containing protein n=2 Tax=Caenorhabditis elegans TaxID=6239 RepID=A0A131MAX2_CAEEL|nr:ABC transporter domain-containing protein [Caenorhabditis elegans]CZR14509.1 ABC transporter domain-containing protein [Caenorhabditis elegans]|eukprot:NP_001309589.1 ABC transporter ATP-binding protein/permease wht-3 [Caenorhabditis elegans]
MPTKMPFDLLAERKRWNAGYESIDTSSQKLTEVVTPITVTWENIEVKTRKKLFSKKQKQLLNRVSGIAKPGEMVALMGARNMKGLEKNGTVKVNGTKIGKEISLISGFAQQQEIFIPTLTVDEYLMIQARLRMKANKHTRRERVDEIIEMLRLQNCRDLKIGTPGLVKGISGGEARRLTFACELLSNPSLLFADEPTSGLDSFMAASVVQILKNLANSGRTLIHQPTAELFFQFDKIIFLSMGKTAFMGTPHESVKFFADCGHPIPKLFNPPEWIQSKLSVIPNNETKSRETIGKIIEFYEKSIIHQKSIVEIRVIATTELPPYIENPGFFAETGALLKRACLDVIRSPAQMRMKLIQKVVMGLFIGSLYWQQPLDPRGVRNTNSALYFLIAELTFSTMFGIMTFMEHELPLIAREYHDGLFYVISYYISRFLSYLPLFTIDGALMIVISYWMIGLNSTWQQVAKSILISVLVEQSATSCGLFLACLFETTSLAIAFAVPASGLFALLSGLYGNTNNFPVYIRWMQWTSWCRYGFEGLVVNQWSQVDNPKWDPFYRELILKQFSFNKDNYQLDVIGLCSIVIFFYLAGYIALFIRIRLSR